MDTSHLIDLGYLFAAILFVLGIKGLTKPRTAVRGNKLAAAGMLIAVVLTLLHKGIISYKLIILGGIIGATIGVTRSEEHTSELQSRGHLVCRLLLAEKNDEIVAI